MNASAQRSDSIRRNAVFALAAQVATATFTAVITVFLARALGTHQYGILALALAISALVAFPADFGVSLSSARFIAERRGDPAAVAAIVVKALRLKVVTLLVALLLFALAGPIASLYGQPDLAWPLRGIAVALLGQNIVFLFANAFVAMGRVAWHFWLTLAEAAIEATATIGLVVLAGTATAAAFGRAIGYLFGAAVGAALILRLLGRRAVRERRGGPRLRQLAFYGGALMIIDGAYVAFGQVPVLLVGGLLGSAAAGVYAAPLRLAAVLHYPGLAMANAIAPRVARHPDHPPEVGALATGLRQLVVLQAAVAVFIAVWAAPIVDLVLGSAFRESGEILQVLAPFIFLQGIGPLVSVSVNYLGEARRRVPIVIGCVFLNLGLAIGLIEWVGILGAAISVDVAYAVYFGAHLWICSRLLDLPLRPLAATAARCVPASAALAGVLLAFGTGDQGLLEWLVAPIVAFGAFAATLILVGEARPSELVTTTRALVGRSPAAAPGVRSPSGHGRRLRMAVYTDYSYRREDGSVFADRAFALFLGRLAEELEEMVVLGRLDPEPGRSHYRLPDSVRFVPLPFYRALWRPVESGLAMARSLRRFWRALDDVDGAWLLGPHPLALAFALLCALRGRTVVLGVRQDTPAYVRRRHPGSRVMALIGSALDAAYRALARRWPTVVVGPDLARRYARAPRRHTLVVSLVREGDIVLGGAGRSYDGELTILSVGRLETEKNPLLLVDVVSQLTTHDRRWRLRVCGDGPLADSLRDRAVALGVADRVELLGYVPLDGGLLDLYRSSHVLLHVSWTEGLPQILYEAFAAGLPVVATAVGGIADAVGGAALLVPPGDAVAAAGEIDRVAGDRRLRERLTAAGRELARRSSLDNECRRLAAFLKAEVPRRPDRR